MIPRAAHVSLSAALLLCFPAMASQPEGLAGKFVTNPAVPGGVDESGLPTVACVSSFAWFELFGPHQLDTADTVALELAIIPLRSGSTHVTLYAADGPFAHLEFLDGLVRGIPYDRSDWNDVSVRLRPATQDYTITVNGATGGPFAIEDFCSQQGGCFSVRALVLQGHSQSEGSVAWIDSVSLHRESAAGRQILHEVTFDRPCATTYLTTGGLLISEPPHRTSARR